MTPRIAAKPTQGKTVHRQTSVPNLGLNTGKPMEQLASDFHERMPSSRIIEELLNQAPPDHFTLGWVASTLHQRSFGIIMLFLGLLAMVPIGSMVPSLLLAVVSVQMIAGQSKPRFPHFVSAGSMPTRYLLRL